MKIIILPTRKIFSSISLFFKDKKLLISFFPYIIFFGLVVFVLYPGLFPPFGKMLFGGDIDRLSYFWLSFFNNELASGRGIPNWNPYLFSGLPYAQAFHSGIYYPLHWLLTFIPLDVAFTYFISIHIFMAMSFMYILVKKYVGMLSGIFSAVAFGLSGPFSAQIWAGHFDAIAAMSYIPLVFYFYLRLVEKFSFRNMSLLSIVISLQFVSGYPVLTLFTLLVILAASLLSSFIKRSLIPSLSTGVSAVIALCVIAVQYIPNSQYLGLTVRTFKISYAWLTNGALEWQHLLELIFPFIHGDQNTYFGPWQFYHERIGYIGLLPILFVICGFIISLINFKKKRIYLLFFTVAIFGLWVSLSYNAPFDLNRLLYEFVPMYQSIRIPTRHMALFVFGASVCSGLALGYFKNIYFKLLIIVITAIDLVFFAKHFILISDIPSSRHDNNLISILKSEKELNRFLPNYNIGDTPRDAIDFAAPAYYNFFSATGYDPSMLKNYFEFVSAVNSTPVPSIIDHDVQVPYLDLASPYVNFLNIKYIQVPPWQDPIGGVGDNRYKLLVDNKSKYFRLYENIDFMPRFFFAENAITFSSRSEIYEFIKSRVAVDLRKNILIEKNNISIDFPEKSLCNNIENQAITVSLYSPNKIILDLNKPSCGQFLQTSEVYYPGWKAYVDGKETKIVESNLAFRSLYVPSGARNIMFKYEPENKFLGITVSVVTCFLLFILCFYADIWIRKLKIF